MKYKKKFPYDEGWLHLSIILVPGKSVNAEDLYFFLGLKGKDVEVGFFQCGKTKATLIAREKKEVTQ